MNGGMSAIGTKRTSLVAAHISAFGSKADIVMRCTCLLLTESGHWSPFPECQLSRYDLLS